MGKEGEGGFGDNVYNRAGERGVTCGGGEALQAQSCRQIDIYQDRQIDSGTLYRGINFVSQFEYYIRPENTKTRTRLF